MSHDAARHRRCSPSLAAPGWVAACVLALWVGGCATRPARVPGESDLTIEAVAFTTPSGAAPALDAKALLGKLGQRAGNPLIPGRRHNPYRQAEDTRRVLAFWQTRGYLDARVIEAAVTPGVEDDEAVRLRWVIEEGPRYTIADVALLEAPPEQVEALEALIPFEAGDPVQLEDYRKARLPMIERLREAGFAHARVYSRAYIDRAARRVHWRYFVDAGPRTRVGSVRVEGAAAVPAPLVERRLGLEVGARAGAAELRAATLDLLDTGAYASVFIESDADVEFVIGKPPPDSGGVMRPEQVSAEGVFQARVLDPALALTVHVVEAPTLQARTDGALLGDATRLDAQVGAGVTWRNALGPLHHLTFEARLGFGWLWRGEAHEPTGVYGMALARYTKPMLGLRLLDGRLTARLRDRLYPGFYLREVHAGPGLRSTLAPGLFFDLDLFFVHSATRGLKAIDEAARAAVALPREASAWGGEGQAGLVWDTRGDRVEARDGHLLGAWTRVAPGGALSTHRYLRLDVDARWHQPLGASWSLGLRAAAGWALLAGGGGAPMTARLFGGGAFGMRGYGLQRLSPEVEACDGDDCLDQPIGGRSLFEGALEARYLPFRQPYGAALFVDLGGADAGLDPFAQGASLAVGLGARLRTWHAPVALDLALRILDRGALESAAELSSYLFFVRVGEAF